MPRAWAPARRRSASVVVVVAAVVVVRSRGRLGRCGCRRVVVVPGPSVVDSPPPPQADVSTARKRIASVAWLRRHARGIETDGHRHRWRRSGWCFGSEDKIDDSGAWSRAARGRAVRSTHTPVALSATTDEQRTRSMRSVVLVELTGPIVPANSGVSGDDREQVDEPEFEQPSDGVAFE